MPKKVQLIYFAGCPNSDKAYELLERSGVPFEEIVQDYLTDENPYRHYSSPTILVDGQIVLGSEASSQSCSVMNLSVAELLKRFQESPQSSRA